MKQAIVILLLFFAHALYAQHDHQQHMMAAPEKPFQVIIFMAVDCPITQKYMTAFKELAARYESQQITLTGYFPAGLTKKGEKEFRAEYQIPELIKLVDDKKREVTVNYNATITPEVVLIDKNQRVIYQGAFDNWFFELGRYRLEVTEHYLIDAIEAALKGEMPAITKTEAIGCFIQQTAKSSEHQHH
jgi:hypothetical protein